MQLERPFEAELCADEHRTAAEGGHKPHVAGEAGRPLCRVDTGRFYDLTPRREVLPAEFAYLCGRCLKIVQTRQKRASASPP